MYIIISFICTNIQTIILHQIYKAFWQYFFLLHTHTKNLLLAGFTWGFFKYVNEKNAIISKQLQGYGHFITSIQLLWGISTEPWLWLCIVPWIYIASLKAALLNNLTLSTGLVFCSLYRSLSHDVKKKNFFFL